MRRRRLVQMVVLSRASCADDKMWRRTRGACRDHADGLSSGRAAHRGGGQGDRWSGAGCTRTSREVALTLFLEGDLSLHAADTRAAEPRSKRRRSPRTVGPLMEAKELAISPRRTEEVTHGLRRVAPASTSWLGYTPGRDALLRPMRSRRWSSADGGVGDDLGCRPTERCARGSQREVADLAQVSTAELEEIETSGAEDRAVQVRPPDDRFAARAHRRLSVARHAQP